MAILLWWGRSKGDSVNASTVLLTNPSDVLQVFQESYVNRWGFALVFV